MRVALLCATRRGYLVLERLIQLVSDSTELIVFSFREEIWEPPFLEDIRNLTIQSRGRFFETKQVGADKWLSFWEASDIDLMLVVSWRYMIPSAVYSRPRNGTFVFHDSLLPAYRGFAPTVWAIINGEDHTGVTLFEIAAAVDSGDIIDQQRISIDLIDTIADVTDRVTQVYILLLEKNLPSLINGNISRTPQNHLNATYTCKRNPEDNKINWNTSSIEIFNLIRASTKPYSGAFTFLSGRELHIWSAKLLNDFRIYVGRIPGRVIEIRPGEGVVVLTIDSAILLLQVQLEGQEAVTADRILTSISQTLR